MRGWSGWAARLRRWLVSVRPVTGHRLPVSPAGDELSERIGQASHLPAPSPRELAATLSGEGEQDGGEGDGGGDGAGDAEAGLAERLRGLAERVALLEARLGVGVTADGASWTGPVSPGGEGDGEVLGRADGEGPRAGRAQGLTGQRARVVRASEMWRGVL
jgi:hypothetical protein